jgi:hypothetical protein
LLFGKQLPFWGGVFGTFMAHFGRPGAPNTHHRKVVICKKEILGCSVGQKMILMFLGNEILAWVTI